VDVPPLQRALAIGAADDPREREADRLADQVVRMSEPYASEIRRMGSQCEETNALQRKAWGGTIRETSAPAIVDEVLHSPVAPLERKTVEFMEPRFGHDFSRVRVHTDTHAANSAQAVDALAYTVGSNIVFARDQYAPTTGRGRRLIAHELAHVIQ